MGGRIKAVADKLDEELINMHAPNGWFCLASPMEMDKRFASGFKLCKFIEGLLVPYLCMQSHYAETQTWLVGELYHGPLGLLQWLAQIKNPSINDIALTYKYLAHYYRETTDQGLSQRPRRHSKCLCGSGKKTHKCHPRFTEALKSLRRVRNQQII